MRNKKKNSTLSSVLQYIKKYYGLLICSMVFAFLSVILMLYIPIVVGDAIDLIVGPGTVDKRIFGLLVRVVVLAVLTALCQWVMNMINNKITYQVVRDIRNEAFEKLQHVPLKYIDGHSYGEIVSRVIADVDQFADGLLMGFTQLFTGVVTIAATLIFYVLYKWMDCTHCGCSHAIVFICGAVYCQKDLSYVFETVRNQGRTDCVDRGDDWEPICGKGISQRR